MSRIDGSEWAPGDNEEEEPEEELSAAELDYLDPNNSADPHAWEKDEYGVYKPVRDDPKDDGE